MTILSMQITEAQLLISGLASGIAVVGVVVRWLVTSPERESAAYKQGVADEQSRCEGDIKQLREEAVLRDERITKLQNALLRLAVASDLSREQRADIANALGFAEEISKHLKIDPQEGGS